MYSINDPDIDTVSDPAPLGELSGNRSDDDGLVIDEAFEAQPNPRMDMTKTGTAAYPSQELPKPTRVLSRQINFFTDGSVFPDPLMIYPADVKRKELIIRWITDLEPTEAVLTLASDKADCYSGANMLMDPTTAGATEWRTTQHTGAVWLAVTRNSVASAAGTIYVSVWVVTE